MAIRSDVTVDFELSPRVITIAAPSVNITCQDLHDTLRKIETDPYSMDNPKLVDTVGKGGGGVTGLAVTLNDAQVLFEPRAVKLETGTATTADSSGRLLTDTNALFISSGVSRGDIILNATDGSHSTVLRVDSSNQLLGLPLAGGIDNQYSTSDSYEIFDYVNCSITGGDIFAVDSSGNSIQPALNSFGVGVLTVEQDTSPAAAPIQPDTIVELDNFGNAVTALGSLKILNSILGGKVSGVTTTQEKFRNPGDTKDRVTVNLDVNGNRTSLVLDLS